MTKGDLLKIKVLDGSGDSEHEFDVTNPQALAEAKQLFERLQSQGLVAFSLTAEGKGGGLQEKFSPDTSVAFSPMAYPG